MKKYHIIYKITNTVNNKIYIGKHSTDNLEDGYMGSGKLIKLAISKYGILKFKKEILYRFNTEEEVQNKEIEIVNKKFINNKNVYNITVGGFGGDSWKHLSENQKTTRSDKIKAHWKKNKHPSTGKKLSINTKNKIRKALKKYNKNKTNEERKKYHENMSVAIKKHYNSKLGKLHKLKSSIMNIGENNPMSIVSIAKRNNCSLDEARKLTPTYGKSRSQHVKDVASKTHKNKIVSKLTREKLSKSLSKYTYEIYNRSTNKTVIVHNLHKWCKINNVSYGILINRANINIELRSRRKAIEWDIKKL